MHLVPAEEPPRQQPVAAKTGLNRGIHRSGWGLLARRLQDKAPGRVEKVDPAYTSQRCSACGLVDRKSRESQAVFRCTACGYACNADVNAARNIAEGQTNAEIAASLVMSVATDKAHVTHILTEIGLSNRTQIAILAHDAGLA